MTFISPLFRSNLFLACHLYWEVEQLTSSLRCLSGPNKFLSNFAKSKLDVNGKSFATAEHYFQARGGPRGTSQDNLL